MGVELQAMGDFITVLLGILKSHKSTSNSKCGSYETSNPGLYVANGSVINVSLWMVVGLRAVGDIITVLLGILKSYKSI